MSRSFVASSSQYLEVDTAAIAAYPFTMACWFKSNDVTGEYYPMFVGDKDIADFFTALRVSGAADTIVAFSHNYDAAAAQRADTSTTYGANTWHHACVTFAGVSSRIAYLDGGGKVEDTDTVGAMVNHDRTTIGRAGDSSPAGYMDGLIAECCIWNVVLTDEEVAALAAGVHPRRIRPSALTHYWPFQNTNLTDQISGLTLVDFNTTTMSTDHPSLTSSMSTLVMPGLKAVVDTSLTTAVVDVVPMRARVEPYPIARWDVVPFDRIPDPWKPGVLAFHQDGISKVEFTVSGQSWSGDTPIVVTAPTFNAQTGVYDFHPTITHSQFSGNGVITIEAKVYPNNAFGQDRVKGTDGGGVGLDQLSFVVDADNALRQTVAYVSPTGNDGTAVIGDRALPYLNPHTAIAAINTADGDCDGAIVYLEAGTYAIGDGPVVTTTNEWLTFTAAPSVERSAVHIDNVETSNVLPVTSLVKIKNVSVKGDERLSVFGVDRSVWIDHCILDGDDRFGNVHPLKVLNTSDALYGTDCETFNCKNGWFDAELLRGCNAHALNNDGIRDCYCVVNCRVEDTDPGGTGNHCDGFQISDGTGLTPHNVIWYNNRFTLMESRAWLTSTTTPMRGFACINLYGHQIAAPNGSAMVIIQQSIDHFIVWNNSYTSPAGISSQFRITDKSLEPLGTPIFLSNVSVKGNHFTKLRMQHGDERNYEPDTGWDRNNYWDADSSIDKEWGTNKTTADPLLTTEGFPASGSSVIDTIPTNYVLEDGIGKVRETPGDGGAYEENVEGNLTLAVVDVIPWPMVDLYVAVVDVTPLVAVAVPTNKLSGSLNAALTTAATIKADAKMSGTSSIALTTSPRLSAISKIDGACSIALTTAGPLKGDAALDSTSAIVLSVPDADLKLSAAMIGTSAIALTTNPVLLGEIFLSGTSTITLTAVGDDLVGSTRMLGTSAMAVTATGTMLSVGGMGSTAAIALTGTGSMKADAKVDGTSAIALTTNGRLETTGDMIATSSIALTTSPTLNAVSKIDGSSAIALTTSPTTKADAKMSGTCTTSMTTSGMAIGLARIQGTAAIAFTGEGTIGFTSGVLIGTSTVTFVLSGTMIAGVPGPYDVQAVHVFIPGAVAAEVHEGGTRAGEVLVPGAVAGQVDN